MKRIWPALGVLTAAVAAPTMGIYGNRIHSYRLIIAAVACALNGNGLIVCAALKRRTAQKNAEPDRLK